MRKVTLVLGAFEGPVEGDVIGVDYGALVCVNKGISMSMACGDFDSVTEDEFKLIQDNTEKVIRLPKEKDDTDFSFAYKQCNDYDSILVLGGLGRRRDHEYVLVVTAIHDSRIILRNEQNLIQLYEPGVHTIQKKGYTYFSVIVTGDSVITLDGFAYPLDKRKISVHDTYLTSNEILKDEAVLTLEGSGVLIIQSNDK